MITYHLIYFHFGLIETLSHWEIEAPSPTPWGSIYRKGSFRITLDNCHQLYYIYIYIYIYGKNWKKINQKWRIYCKREFMLNISVLMNLRQDFIMLIEQHVVSLSKGLMMVH